MLISQLHLIATTLMAGVIVFVQVVHYPLMERTGVDAFPAYEEGHTQRTGWVVGPLMIVELATAIWLAAASTSAVTGSALSYLGLGLLAVIWASTALLQGPIHGKLIKGFDPVLHRRLVVTNWIRTLAWLARVPVAIGLQA